MFSPSNTVTVTGWKVVIIYWA